MNINDDAKRIAQELGAAINAAVERSPEVADAIAQLREAGYEMELVIKLLIGLRELDADAGDDGSDASLDLTEEDRRTLRNMKIRIDEIE